MSGSQPLVVPLICLGSGVDSGIPAGCSGHRRAGGGRRANGGHRRWQYAGEASLVQEQRNVADPILQTGKGPFMKTPGGRESGQICSRLRSRRDGRVWKLAWNNSRSLARARV